MELELSTPSKTLLNGRENSNPIPIDIVIEILLRLPVKSIGRCCCVSKLWASVLCRPLFKDLFFTKSSARPHVLFTYSGKGEVLFFSSPQPQNPDENLPYYLAANYLSRVSYGGSCCTISGPVHGLVCLTYIEKEVSSERIIFNPSTGQALTLPKVVGVRKNSVEVSFLGYDPIKKQFKLLSLEECSDHSISLVDGRHQVLILGTQKLEWRMIKCCIPHHSYRSEICINGVLYYPAVNAYTLAPMIVCFDVSSEEFSSIEVETIFEEAVFSGKLINYNGKLGSFISQVCFYDRGEIISFELLVIGDSEKQEWSKHKYVLPDMWKYMVREVLRFVGFIGTNVIVLSHPCYVIYYNIEKSNIVKVGIQGVKAFKRFGCSLFLDHVDGLQLMQAF